jgi:ubiquinone/menaquinone biosynthesis C-methylase UbiE
VPETYTHGHHESVLRSHRWRTAENSAAYLLPRLAPGQSLLDVGCGPGTITIDLARRVAPGRVIGMDAVDEPLIAARADAAAAGLETVAFEVGDAYALEFEAERFDVVHAHQVSSISATRSRRCARWVASAGSMGSSRPATATPRR